MYEYGTVQVQTIGSASTGTKHVGTFLNPAVMLASALITVTLQYTPVAMFLTSRHISGCLPTMSMILYNIQYPCIHIKAIHRLVPPPSRVTLRHSRGPGLWPAMH